MTSDPELLRRYARDGDETAFAELVRRHVDLVYATALRLAHGNTALAEDATQTVFTDLARKAGTLLNHPTLTGWLHTGARFAALTALRKEQSRHEHEQEASAMNDLNATSAEISWTQLRPWLDEALGHLREHERDAVLLRFFQDKSYREVGGILGVTENAAQMRVERALEKLRGQFSRRNIATTAALLASVLGAHGAAIHAPVGFEAAVTAKSLASATSVSASGSIVGAHRKLTRPRPALVAAMLVVFVGLVAFLLHQTKPALPPSVATTTNTGQIELPKAPVITVDAKASTDTTTNVQNLGKVDLAAMDSIDNRPSPKIFTLKSGLIFSLQSVNGNPDGTLNLAYGAYETKRPENFTLVSMGDTDQPPAISIVNNFYELPVTAGKLITINFDNGQSVSFTPNFAPVKVDMNELGVVNLVRDQPVTFTLHSGKVLELEYTDLPPDPSPMPPHSVSPASLGYIGAIHFTYFSTPQDYSSNTNDHGFRFEVKPGNNNRQLEEMIEVGEYVRFTPQF